MSAKNTDTLVEGTLLRITIPLTGGTRISLDGAVETCEQQVVVCIDDSEFSVPPAVNTEGWVMTRDLGDTILLYHARLGKRLGPCRFALDLESVLQHAATRRDERIETEVQIREWSEVTGWSRLRKGENRRVTLSRRGIGFLSQDRFHPGQRLNLEIALPGMGQPPLQTTGEVFRCQQREMFRYEVIISFVDLDQESSDRLETFFITRQFRSLHKRVKLLGNALSPSFEAPSDDPDQDN